MLRADRGLAPDLRPSGKMNEADARSRIRTPPAPIPDPLPGRRRAPRVRDRGPRSSRPQPLRAVSFGQFLLLAAPAVAGQEGYALLVLRLFRARLRPVEDWI